jgi:hypothetical protein
VAGVQAPEPERRPADELQLRVRGKNLGGTDAGGDGKCFYATHGVSSYINTYYCGWN